ncbi:MAG TPA: TIGR03086 family metal-binding protein [Nocardioidaceae bacterium]|nr:TIGR03086 family metal-binding protein [Nocardioidaceae bacterium]
MTENRISEPLIGGLGLLERSIGFALGSLALVTSEAITRPSPCQGWDLHALLRHMNDSLEALHEAVSVGQVELPPALNYGDRTLDPVVTLRNRAASMLGAWTNSEAGRWVSVAGRPVTSSLVAATGALEITVHGWDVSWSMGDPRPIPRPLAEELLPLASLLVTDADRPARFAREVETSPWAEPGERLLGFLGRATG